MKPHMDRNDWENSLASAGRVEHRPSNEAELRYATRLALYLWETHWKEASPHWKPLPDLMGVLTQIDNMIANLKPQKEGRP